MRRSYVVCAVIAIAALVVGWRLACGGGDSASSADEAGSASTTLRTSARRGTRAAPAALSGRVTRQHDGSGIAGAVVSLAKAELGAMFSPGAEPTTIAITDATGAWTVPALPPSTYHVAATAVGFLPAVKEKLVVAAGARETVDVALVAGGNLVSGKVSDVGGGGIGGARITARSESTLRAGLVEYVAVTTGDGTYQLTLPDGAYFVTATHDDYASENGQVFVRAEPRTLDFRLVPGAQIRGQVVTREGVPVPGAMVLVRSVTGRGRNSNEPAFADDDGNFTLTGLDSGSIAITAAAPGFSSAGALAVAIGIGEHVANVRLVVDKALGVSGRVVRAGKPTEGIAGVRLGLFTMTGAFAVAIDPTAEDGSFAIIGVQPGGYMLFAMSEDVVPEIGKTIDVADHDVTGLIIEMSRGVTLRGRVEPGVVAMLGIQSKGDPLAGDNVFASIKASMVHGESDATGAFTLKAVPAGSYTLSARATEGDVGSIAIEVADEDQSGLVVRLEKRASIAGKVVDERGTPVPGVRVSTRPTDVASAAPMLTSDTGIAITGTGGAFRIVGLEPGTYQLTTDASRLEDPPVSVELAPAQARTGMTLTVAARDGVIRGLVVDKANKPLADAWVSAQLTGELVLDEPVAAVVDRAGAVLTNADGRFTIDKLQRGTYALAVEGPKNGSRGRKANVKTGEAVTITLEPLGSLSGRVTRNNAPVTSYDLACRRDVYDPIFGTQRFASASGAYQLERLAPGTYKCTATADGGHGSASIEIGNSAATLDLTLAAWATVTGTVVSALDGKPVAGLAVIAAPSDDNQFSDLYSGRTPTTDANGRFVADRVRSGEIMVRVMPKGMMIQELAKTHTVIAAGERWDAGTLKVVPPRENGGTLGITGMINGEDQLIAWVKGDGPAAKAGVVDGDRIVMIDGRTVAQLGLDSAQRLLAEGAFAIGQTVVLGLERDGKSIAITVVAVKW